MKTKKPTSYRRRSLYLALIFLVTLALYCLFIDYAFTPQQAIRTQIERNLPMVKTELVLREKVEVDPTDYVRLPKAAYWQLQKSDSALLAVELEYYPLFGWLCRSHNAVDVDPDLPFCIGTNYALGPNYLFGRISDPYATEITMHFLPFDSEDNGNFDPLTLSTREMKVQDGEYYFAYCIPLKDEYRLTCYLSEVTLTARDGSVQHFTFPDRSIALALHPTSL